MLAEQDGDRSSNATRSKIKDFTVNQPRMQSFSRITRALSLGSSMHRQPRTIQVSIFWLCHAHTACIWSDDLRSACAGMRAR